jgi:hypothetical protein
MSTQTRDTTRDLSVHLGYRFSRRNFGLDYFPVVEIENSEGQLTRRFVGEHGYRTEDEALAVGAEMYDAIIELLRTMGYNIVELHSN